MRLSLSKDIPSTKERDGNTSSKEGSCVERRGRGRGGKQGADRRLSKRIATRTDETGRKARKRTNCGGQTPSSVTSSYLDLAPRDDELVVCGSIAYSGMSRLCARLTKSLLHEMAFLHDDTSTLHHCRMRYYDRRRSVRPFWTIRSSLFFFSKMQSRYVPAKRHIQRHGRCASRNHARACSVGQQTLITVFCWPSGHCSL